MLVTTQGHGTDFPRATSPADPWLRDRWPLGVREVTALCCHMLPQAYDTATGRRRIGFAVQKHRVRKGLEVQDSCVQRGPLRKIKTEEKKQYDDRQNEDVARKAKALDRWCLTFATVRRHGAGLGYRWRRHPEKKGSWARGPQGSGPWRQTGVIIATSRSERPAT